MKLMILTSLLSFAIGIAAANAADKSAVEHVKVEVTETGFEPSEIKVKSGSHVILNVTRMTDATCATNIQFKEKKIKKELPLNKEVNIDLGVVQKGDVRFACGMDMISGHVVAD